MPIVIGGESFPFSISLFLHISFSMTLLPTFRLAATVVALSLLTMVLPAEESWETLYLSNRQDDKSDHWQTRLWAVPYGNWERCQTEEMIGGFRSDTFGMMAGFDRKRNSRFSWGAGAGGSWISARSDRGSGNKDIDSFKTLLQAKAEVKDWRFTLGAGYGHNTQTTERHAHNGFFQGHNHANQWGMRADFCLKMGMGLFAMEPFFAAECHTFSESGYSEKRFSGAGLSKSFGKSTEDSFATSLGVRYYWRQTGHLIVWRPELSATWLHEFGSDRLFRSSQLDPFPTFYTFPDANVQRDHLLFTVGVTGNLGSTMDIFAKYATDIAGDDTAHSVLCGTNWKF